MPATLSAEQRRATLPALDLRGIAFLLGSFLVGLAILILRNPAAISHPQFYSEDGTVWFADAYNDGLWRPFLQPYQGYFHTLPRLAAAAAVFFPISRGLLVMILTAFFFEALPVPILLSNRAREWGSTGFRMLLALAYLLLSNCDELLGIITQSNWPIALSGFLVLTLSKPETLLESCIDAAILSLSAASGPFCILLLPIALLLQRRERSGWMRPTILAVGSVIQLFAILTSHRVHPELGASAHLLLQILGGQIFLSSFLGSTQAGAIVPIGVLFVAIAFGTLVVAAAAAASRQLFFLVCFSVVLLIGALLSPVLIIYFLRSHNTCWEILNLTVGGSHYWFFPSLTIAWSVLFCLRRKDQASKVIGTVALLILLVGIVRDFRPGPHTPITDIRAIESRVLHAPRGTPVVVAIYPPGWTMTLIKR